MKKFLRKFWRGLFYGVSVQDQINFARHLAIVIKAGLPLLEGLKIIRKQTEAKPLLNIIDRVEEDVKNGQFLATSLSRFPEVFGDFFINVVRVGETSGTLSENLIYIAEELKRSHDLRNKVRSAMVYPAIIAFATAALITFLIFFAFPKILPLFASLNVELPLPTRILIAVASFVLANGLGIVIALILLAALFKVLFAVPTVRYLVDKMLFRVPVLSGLIVNMNMANFARVFSVLLNGGIKIVEAVTITAHTFDNLVYRRELLAAAEEVRRGEQLAHHLSAKRRVFPLLLSGLIEIGENTGNLESNLKYLADYYKDETEMRLRNLTALLEPLLLLTMGLLVGFVAISVITPIYQITQGV